MRTPFLLSLIVLFLFSCRESRPRYTLSGKFGNGNDTLLVFGLDRRYDRIDTIATDSKGGFSYRVETDTLLPLIMALPDGQIMPLYAEPQIEATLITDSTTQSYRVKGGSVQMLYDSIASKLRSLDERSQRYEAIEEFIEQHPLSEVNIFLLQRHFIEIPDARNAIIRNRIEKLGGTLQDNDYLYTIKEKVKQKQSNIQHKAFPDFSFTTADSMNIERKDFIDKYIVVTFWASWDSASVTHMRELSRLYATSDTAYLALINIAIDHDTAAWRHTITTDSIAGNNVCDTKLWDNSLATEFTIEKLPFSLLVNPYLRIDRFNISANDLETSIDSLIIKFKEKEKDKEKRKKERDRLQKSKEDKEKASQTDNEATQEKREISSKIIGIPQIKKNDKQIAPDTQGQ